MQKLYYFPSTRKKGYGNPYSTNYKAALRKYYKVVDVFGMQAGVAFCLLCHTFIADIYILNWIENIRGAKFGIIQFWLARLSLKIIKLRKKKIVWMLHNLQPHNGADKYSEYITSYLFEYADIIICHSTAALTFAKDKAKGRVAYICHPVAPIALKEEWNDAPCSCDVLIWGDISPYKGIVEFISNKQVRESKLNIFIIGRCPDISLCRQIEDACSSHIRFENRRASYEGLKAQMAKARYVLFPYLPGSVSSSGALIDTITLGGTPVGPNIGAFKDLAEEGVCLLYDDYADLLDILSSHRTIDDVKRRDFISQNTWDSFAMKLFTYIN